VVSFFSRRVDLKPSLTLLARGRNDVVAGVIPAIRASRVNPVELFR
jgi:hypothetical protein